MHGLVASAIYLPPPSDAWWDRKALPLPRLIFFDKIRHFRSWTHQTHISADHVDKLWQFIQAKAAQKSSHARDSRIFLRLMQQIAIQVTLLHLTLQLFSILEHGPEFEHFKQPSIFSNPLLAKQNRGAIFEENHQCRACHKWQSN